MTSWLLNLSKWQLAELPRGAHLKLVWHPTVWWWWLILLLGPLLVYLIYQQDAAQLPPWRRYLLTGLRGLSLLLVLLIICDPVLTYDLHFHNDGVLAVLVDRSTSMRLKDRYPPGARTTALAEAIARPVTELQNGNLSRAQITALLLDNPKLDLLTRWALKNRLQLYTFAQQLHLCAVIPKQSTHPTKKISWRLPATLNGLTNLGQALEQVLDELSGMRLAGVVLFSDGCWNTGRRPQEAARLAARQEPPVPIYVIGLGQEQAPKNVAVRSIFSPAAVLRDDPVVFQVEVVSQGYRYIATQLYLERRKRGQDQFTVVQRKIIRLVSQGTVQSTTITDRHPPGVGEYLYRVRIPKLIGEATTQDNQQERIVRVIDERTQVLLIAGAPTYEYRFLKNFLWRAPNIRLAAWLQSAAPGWPQEGHVSLSTCPCDLAQLKKYDLILLIDPDVRALKHSWCTAVQQCVAREGAGLIYVAGEKYTPGLWQQTQAGPLLELLPVKSRRLGLQERLAPTQVKQWHLCLAREGRNHPLTTLGAPSQNATLWRQLPGFYWSLPITYINPLARVLLKRSKPQARTLQGQAAPLALVQFYGAGRVLFLAFDATYRWRATALRCYQRFWGQGIRYLIGGKLFRGQTQARITTNKDRYLLGEEMVIWAQVLPKAPLLYRANTLTALLNMAGHTQRLHLQAVGLGKFEGSWVTRRTGQLKISLAQIPAKYVADKSVLITGDTLETSCLQMDRPTLTSIATLSQGRYLSFEQLKDLPEQIQDRSETVIQPGVRQRLWDNQVTLLLLVSLLAIEWWLRKRSHLS